MAFLRQEARVIERFRIIEVTEAARRFGCSRTTVYKLIARYREGGLRGADEPPSGSPGADPRRGGGVASYSIEV